MLDLDRVLAPVSDDLPCGPDLRDELEFQELEEAPAEFAQKNEAELRQIVSKCDAMLGRTKDHVPALVALQAAFRIGDLAMAASAARALHGLAQTYWEGFHPAPAGEMIVARINEVAALARPAAIALPLAKVSLAELPAPSSQRFTVEMLAAACSPVAEWSSQDEEDLAGQVTSGQVTATAAKSYRPTREGARTLRGLMRTLSDTARTADSEAGIAPAELPVAPEMAAALATQIRDRVAASRDALTAVSDALYETLEIYDRNAGDSPGIGAGHTAIRTAIAAATEFVEAFTPPAAIEFDAPVETGEGGEPAAGAAPTPRQGFVPSVPRTRNDVLLAIDTIAQYYRDQEPTSPVPLMLARLRRWVSMDFLQLLGEIAPGGADEAQALLATSNE